MILGYYKVLCDECKWEIDEISYEPNEVDLKERNIIVYDGKTFCCNECLESYKSSKS